MLTKTRGIVFHYIRYSDSSIIVTIYTEAFGRKSFLVKGVFRTHSRFKINLFQPLSILEMDTSLSARRELQSLKEVISAYPLMNVIGNHRKQSLVFFIAEMLYKTVREEEANPKLYEFLHHSVLFLDASDEIANFHLVFLLQLSRFLGFYPQNDYSAILSRFNTLLGSFVDETDLDIHTYHPRISLKTHQLLISNYSSANSVTLNRQERNELLEMIIDFYKLHLHTNINIQSLQILKEIFD